MAFVQLSADTLTVTGLFGGPQPGNAAVTQIADNDPRVLAFGVPTVAQAALAQLQANDAQIFRALELMIDVLLSKNVTAGVPLFAATDFPPAVRALYVARKALRVTAGVP